MSSTISVPNTATQTQRIRWMKTYSHFFNMLANQLSLKGQAADTVGLNAVLIDEQARTLANAYHETARQVFHTADAVPDEAAAL